MTYIGRRRDKDEHIVGKSLRPNVTFATLKTFVCNVSSSRTCIWMLAVLILLEAVKLVELVMAIMYAVMFAAQASFEPCSIKFTQ
jgi:hypothetical protein